jgi:hypothetical protein
VQLRPPDSPRLISYISLAGRILARSSSTESDRSPQSRTPGLLSYYVYPFDIIIGLVQEITVPPLQSPLYRGYHFSRNTLLVIAIAATQLVFLLRITAGVTTYTTRHPWRRQPSSLHFVSVAGKRRARLCLGDRPTHITENLNGAVQAISAWFSFGNQVVMADKGQTRRDVVGSVTRPSSE